MKAVQVMFDETLLAELDETADVKERGRSAVLRQLANVDRWVVLSRQKAICLLRTVLVAPITSSIHGAPSEVLVGFEEGSSTIRRSTWIRFRPWIRESSISSSARLGARRWTRFARL